MSREWTKNPQKLEILLQNFADIIWEYDTQAKDLYPETECAQRFGPARPVIHNGAQGLVQSGILHPDYLPSLSHVFRSLESQECTLSAELLSRLGCLSWDYRWYRAVFTSYLDDAGICRQWVFFRILTARCSTG